MDLVVPDIDLKALRDVDCMYAGHDPVVTNRDSLKIAELRSLHDDG